nr:hypothetical protein [Tanacetum cinerariifolium]
MATPVISISSDVSVESVRSSFLRVILIDSIFVEVPVAPEVGAAVVSLPTGVLELDTHSLSEADPSKSSPRPVSVAPMVLPFLCSDDSESDTEMPERHVSPKPHDAMLTRWRSRVASRSSSPTTSTLEILLLPFYLHHLLLEDIPIGRLYRTHPGTPCRALTARKPVRPLPSHRLALRYTSHHLDRFTSGSSSGHSSSDHSSSRHSITGHSLFGHASPDTIIVDSSTPSRFVYPSLARTPWCSEAYLRWRSAPLSTMYRPKTSDSSIRDYSFESSDGLSRKRCRSLTATMTSFVHATRALVPSHADLFPPRKRFRDSISTDDSVEEEIDANELANIKVDATAVKVVVNRDVEAEVDACIGMEVDVGVDVGHGIEDEVESNDMGTIEVRADVVARIDIPDGMLMPDVVKRLEQRELEARSLITCGERASLLEQVASLKRSNARFRGTMMMERARADSFWRRISFMESELRQIRRFRYYDKIRFRRLETFAARHLGFRPLCYNMTITRSGMTPEAESQSQNGSDGDNGYGGNGNGGDGNGGNGNSGSGNTNENNRGARPVARECTYQDFMKC